MGSTGGVSSLGGCLNNEGVVSCAPWASVEFDSMSPTSAMVAGVMGSPWGITLSWLTVSGVILPRFQKMSCLSKVTVPLHMLHQLHNAHHQRAIIWKGWQSNFLHPILQCSGISHGQQQGLPLDVLIGQIVGEKATPGETFGGRGMQCSLGLGGPHT